jgi:hypothetical protein
MGRLGRRVVRQQDTWCELTGGFLGGSKRDLASMSMKSAVTASSLTAVRRNASKASHHPAGKRHGGAARWGTGLARAVVAVMATGGFAWASGLNPILSMAGAGSAKAVAPVGAVSITPSATRPATPMYPGGSGAVTFAVTNHASVAVRVSAVSLPSGASYAAAFRDRTNTVATPGCTAHNSGVDWRGATRVAGSVHRLATPLTVGAGQTRLVTIIGAAAMSPSSPLACQGRYFVMPSLTGISATPTTGPVGSAPVVDTWN